MNAIVYTSNTGYTEKYAKLLSTATGIPSFSFDEAQTLVSKDIKIIYMGWLMAGSVKGYASALKKWDIGVVCAVGMAFSSEEMVRKIAAQNKIDPSQLFYLRGGFDMKKLHGIHLFMMKIMRFIVGGSLKRKADKSPAETAMLDALFNGRDCVDEENLKEITAWIDKNRKNAL